MKIKQIIPFIFLLLCANSFSQIKYFTSNESCDYTSTGCNYKPLFTAFELDDENRTLKMTFTVNGKKIPTIKYHILKRKSSMKNTLSYKVIDEYGNSTGTSIIIDLQTAVLLHTANTKNTMFKLVQN